MTAFLADHPDPTDDQVREAIAGNLCMCTGYHNIVRAARRLREAGSGQLKPSRPTKERGSDTTR